MTVFDDLGEKLLKATEQLRLAGRKIFEPAGLESDDDIIPEHYKIGNLDIMQTIIAIVENNNLDVRMSIFLFNTLKYLFRFGNKDGLKDLYKALDYLERLIAAYEEEGEKENVWKIK